MGHHGPTMNMVRSKIRCRGAGGRGWGPRSFEIFLPYRHPLLRRLSASSLGLPVAGRSTTGRRPRPPPQRSPKPRSENGRTLVDIQQVGDQNRFLRSGAPRRFRIRQHQIGGGTPPGRQFRDMFHRTTPTGRMGRPVRADSDVARAPLQPCTTPWPGRTPKTGPRRRGGEVGGGPAVTPRHRRSSTENDTPPRRKCTGRGPPVDLPMAATAAPGAPTRPGDPSLHADFPTGDRREVFTGTGRSDPFPG